MNLTPVSPPGPCNLAPFEFEMSSRQEAYADRLAVYFNKPAVELKFECDVDDQQQIDESDSDTESTFNCIYTPSLWTPAMLFI